MRFISSHRIFDFMVFCRRYAPIDDWIVSNHALIHSVKCNFLKIWCGKNSSIDSEFISVNRLSVDDIFVLVICDFQCFSIDVYKKIIFDGVNNRLIIREKLSVFCLFRNRSKFCFLPRISRFLKPKIFSFLRKIGFRIVQKFQWRKSFQFLVSTQILIYLIQRNQSI